MGGISNVGVPSPPTVFCQTKPRGLRKTPYGKAIRRKSGVTITRKRGLACGFRPFAPERSFYLAKFA